MVAGGAHTPTTIYSYIFIIVPFDLDSVQTPSNHSDMFTGSCITNNSAYVNIVSY